MAEVCFTDATRRFPGGRTRGSGAPRPPRRRRRVPRARRSVRLRQDDVSAHARRPRARRLRCDLYIGGRDVTELAPRERDVAIGLPKPCPLPAHVGGGQHGLRVMWPRLARRKARRIAGTGADKSSHALTVPAAVVAVESALPRSTRRRELPRTRRRRATQRRGNPLLRPERGDRRGTQLPAPWRSTSARSCCSGRCSILVRERRVSSSS